MTQGRDRHDTNTGDLLSWEPPAVVRRFDETRIRKATLRARVAGAVSETLKDCELGREEIAERMSEWLGEEVTKNMLDAYASEAREAHTITYHRLVALIHVTGDVRPLQTGAEMFGHLVVDNKFMKFIELGLKTERSERIKRLDSELDNEIKAALREIRSGYS